MPRELTYYKATKQDGTIATRGSTRGGEHGFTHAYIWAGDIHGSSGASWTSDPRKLRVRGDGELCVAVEITAKEYRELKAKAFAEVEAKRAAFRASRSNAGA